jgi:DUF438 domain-containing protein
MSETWSDLLMRDHETTEKVFEAGAKAFSGPGGPDRRIVSQLLAYFTEYVDGCHNKKEEGHLFPLIERRGVPREGGPLAIMLQEHQQSRDLLAKLKSVAEDFVAGRTEDSAELHSLFTEYTEFLKNHFWKENDVLYPMARRVMSEDDGAVVVKGIEATEAALGEGTRDKYYSLAQRIIESGQLKDLAHNLDHDTLAAILNRLPVELSFVDADDTVRYFSHENHTKIFPRTRGAIGMKVQQCHPSKSVHLVNQILRDFKAGRRDVAEFWIDFQGMKVHIRYWPVRAPDGEYLGCLETVQDVTAIQALSGERRLLDESG